MIVYCALTKNRFREGIRTLGSMFPPSLLLCIMEHRDLSPYDKALFTELFVNIYCNHYTLPHIIKLKRLKVVQSGVDESELEERRKMFFWKFSEET